MRFRLFNMENLEELKNKYEGKQMIAKREDMFGIKKKITIHSLVIISNDEKETVNFNYSWQSNKSEDIPISWNIIPIEEILNNWYY